MYYVSRNTVRRSKCGVKQNRKTFAPILLRLRAMRLTFWGAAGTVTGSMHLVETENRRILLDGGLFRARRKDADAKNRRLPFPASSIDGVILSHAHIDHSG